MASTKVVLEAATAAEAIQKAARVAPSKGAAFDKAAGICIKVDSVNKKVQIQATDLETEYFHNLEPLSVSGPDREWRIPSAVLAGFMSTVSMAAGSQVTFIDPDQGDQAIRLQAGTATLKLVMFADEFPRLKYPEGTGKDANDFSTCVPRVSWACARDGSMYAGVHITGDTLIGCNKYMAAIMPCKVPVEAPITIPLANVSTIIQKATDLTVWGDEQIFNVKCDRESGFTTRLYAGKYPDVMGLIRDDFTGEVEVPRQAMVDTIQKILVLAKQDRLPIITFGISGVGMFPEITIDAIVADVGRMRDSVTVGGDFKDTIDIAFQPMNIMQAFENAVGEKVRFQFGHPDPARSKIAMVMVSDESGYRALVQPHRS